MFVFEWNVDLKIVSRPPPPPSAAGEINVTYSDDENSPSDETNVSGETNVTDTADVTDVTGLSNLTDETVVSYRINTM